MALKAAGLPVLSRTEEAVMFLTGQVGVVTTRPGWYGRAVQIWTGSKAFHTVYAISETQVVSAETPTVVLRPIDFYDVEWTNVPLTDEQRHQGVSFVKRQVGKPYAYFDIVLLAIASILKTHTPDWILDRVDTTDRWFCSELCDAGMIAAGVNIFPGRPACAVTPKDFDEAIREPQPS